MLYVNNNTCGTAHNIQYRLTRQRLRGCSCSSSSWRTVSVMTYTLSPSLTSLVSSPDTAPASLEPFLDELPLILRSIDRDLICSDYVKPEFFFIYFQTLSFIAIALNFTLLRKLILFNCFPYHTKFLCRTE